MQSISAQECVTQRLACTELTKLLSIFPAVAVRGPHYCGKTELAAQLAHSTLQLTNPKIKPLLEADLSLLEHYEQPCLIEESFEVRGIWDYVRYYIDEHPQYSPDMDAINDDAANPKTARFILTTSREPEDTEYSHSGAGRIARMNMHPLTLYEVRGGAAGSDPLPTVSLAALLKQSIETRRANELKERQAGFLKVPALPSPVDACKPQPAAVSLRDYFSLFTRGGWPELQLLSPEEAQALISAKLNNFFETAFFTGTITPEAARTITTALARNMGAATNYTALAKEAYCAAKPTKQQQLNVAAVIQTLRAHYLIDEVAGWDAPICTRSRARTSVKHNFTCPSLFSALLGVTPEQLYTDASAVSALFKSLVMRDMRVFTEHLPYAVCAAENAGMPAPAIGGNSLFRAAAPCYYRDARGLEVDGVLTLYDDEWMAWNAVLGEADVPEAAERLVRLQKMIARNPAAPRPQPACLVVFVAAGEYIQYRYDSNVYVIPFACLAP